MSKMKIEDFIVTKSFFSKRKKKLKQKKKHHFRQLNLMIDF